jgi:hypothetical protein
MSRGLTAQEHLELGSVLKEARRLLLEAAAQSRYYRNISRQLFEIADALMGPRAELERKLIEAVGENGIVESQRSAREASDCWDSTRRNAWEGDAWNAGASEIGSERATAPPTSHCGGEEAREGAMTDISLINDPSDFIPTPTELKGKKWAKWFEGGELLTSLVSECIDFEVKETALETAHRRGWRLIERKEDDQNRATEKTS